MAAFQASLSVMMARRSTWVCVIQIDTLEDQKITIISIFIIATSEGILEWNVITTNSLRDICLRYIRKRRDMWDALGWDMTSLPADLQEVIPVSAPRDSDNTTNTNHNSTPPHPHTPPQTQRRSNVADDEDSDPPSNLKRRMLFAPPPTIYTT